MENTQKAAAVGESQSVEWFVTLALVVICGQPCSGKSTTATSLAEALKESDRKFSVRIIDKASFHLDRNQNYVNMPAEKNLRGVLRSEVDRSVSKDNIIIVDSLNSIKGNQCQQWNKGRKEKGEAAYDDAIFDDLARRFERPDSRNRATQEVISVIVEAQSQALGGPMNGISIGQDLPTLNVSKSVRLPELRRLRLTFMKLTGQTSLSRRPPPSDAKSAKRMFVDYLNRELDTA
ncbi:Protein KTI12 homolog [Linum perenne]